VGYRIERKEQVGEAVRRIVREQLRSAIRVARDRKLGQEERVHEVRTRLKRSRAALALIRREVGGKAERDDRRLRDAGRLLARPRDLAVQAHTFRVLGTRLQAELPPRLLARLAAAERQIRRSLEPEDVERDLKRAARALRRLRRDLSKWGVDKGRRAIGDGVTRTYRSGLETLEAARERPSPERFHDWRKQVKALYYELRIIAAAVPELTTTLMPKIERLGEILGQVHDLDCVKATAELHPRWFGRAADGEAVLAAVEERRGELENEALTLARSVFAGRARDVRALVKTGWKLWHRVPASEAADDDVRFG
jgi:CHAD domain-containing protein